MNRLVMDSNGSGHIVATRINQVSAARHTLHSLAPSRPPPSHWTRSSVFDIFDESTEALRASVREFASDQLASGYIERAASSDFPWKEVRALAEMGLLGIGIPAQYGGAGVGENDSLNLGVCAEEVGGADINTGFALVMSGLTGRLLSEHAPPALAQAWIPRMVSGDCVVGFGLSEEGHGSDAASLETQAVRTSGGYSITGVKNSVTALSVADATIVFARIRGEKGVSAFLVPTDTVGVSRGIYNDMGCRPLGRGTLYLDDVHIPSGNLIGQEGRAFREIMRGFDLSRVLISLMVLSCANSSLVEASRAATSRRAFGSALSKWEGISFPMAEHHTFIQGARGLAYQALWKRDRSTPHSKEAAMAKWWSTDIAIDAIRTCMNVQGHGSYSDELPDQFRLRDVMGYVLADGSPEIMKIVVAREAYGREFVPYI